MGKGLYLCTFESNGCHFLSFCMIMDQSPQVGIYASQHIYAYKSRDTTYTPITLATSRNDLLMYNTGFYL